jgi:hypothetical protein
MSDPNGWPDKPGVPKNPEQNRTHRLVFPRGEHDWLWRAGLHPFWVTHTGRLVEPAEIPSFRTRYLGPCLTPAEVAARVAETRTKALEEAAAWHDEQAAYCAQRAQERLSDGWPEAMAVLKTTQASHLHSAAAIRALKEPDHLRDAAKMVQAREGGG